jgi:hypothetical protein
MVEMVLNFRARDGQLLKLFLTEGRRIRNDGTQTVLVPGFLEFVKPIDRILKELADQGELKPSGMYLK